MTRLAAALHRAGSASARTPFAVTAALLVVVASVTSVLVRRADLEARPGHHGAADATMGLLHPFAVTTGVAALVVTVTGVLVLVGGAERLLGWRRTAGAFVLTTVVGTGLGGFAALVDADGRRPVPLLLGRATSFDPWTAVVGTVMTASAFAGPLWRRRMRVVTGAVVAALLLYAGHASDLYAALAAVAGFVLGVLLRREPPRLGWQRSSRAETRVLLGTAVLVSAVGPVIAVVARARIGLLAPLAAVVMTGPGAVHANAPCSIHDVTASCADAMLRGSVGLAQVPVAVVLVLLAVGGVGLLRGSRVAVWTVAVVDTGAGVAAAVTYGLLPHRSLARPGVRTPLADDHLALTVSILASVAVPLATAVVLVLLRGAFPPRRARGSGGDEARARALLLTGGGDTFGWMTTWSGLDRWFSADGRAAIAYRRSGRIALTVGGPFGHADARPDALLAFARHCDDRGLVPVYYGVDAPVAAVVRRVGWSTLPVAEDADLDPRTWTAAGKRKQDVRTAVNRAARDGVRAEWSDWASLPLAVTRQVRAISEEWVGGRELPEMGFTLGGIDEMRDPAVRVLVALDAADRVLAVTSWLPSFRDGVVVGWTLDVMRRSPTAPNGVMEFLVARAVDHAREQGAERLGLSAAPLAASTGSAGGGGGDTVLNLVGEALEPVYGFRSLLRFKAKFGPALRPLVMAYPDPVALPEIGIAIVRAYLPGLSLRGAIAIVRGRPR